jgi:hypothetical protein
MRIQMGGMPNVQAPHVPAPQVQGPYMQGPQMSMSGMTPHVQGPYVQPPPMRERDVPSGNKLLWIIIGLGAALVAVLVVVLLKK